MTKRQEQRAYRKVNAAAIALLVAESELMETAIPPLVANIDLGQVLDAAHDTVERLTDAVRDGPPPPCEDCNSHGWLIFTDNQIQRCDQCQRFAGDLDAAVAFFRNPAGSQGVSLSAITIRTRLQTSAHA